MFTQKINLSENKEFNTFSIFVEIEDEYLIVTSDKQENLNRFIANLHKTSSYENEQGKEFYSVGTELIKNLDIQDVTEEVKLFESYFQKSITQKLSKNLKEFEILLNSFNGINTLIENKTRDVVVWIDKNEFLEYINENLEDDKKINSIDEAEEKGFELEVVYNSVIEFVG